MGKAHFIVVANQTYFLEYIKYKISLMQLFARTKGHPIHMSQVELKIT